MHTRDDPELQAYDAVNRISREADSLLAIADDCEAVGMTKLAERIAFQSGTPSSELAGLMLSVLARDPSLLDRFMVDGSEMFLEGAFAPERGRLSWYGQNGAIVTPQFMRAHLGKRDH